MVKENNIIRINNTKIKDTMALLQNKLDEVGMSQAELARELKRNKVTINRWSHNTRDISAANAIEIAKVLKKVIEKLLFQKVFTHRKQKLFNFIIQAQKIITKFIYLKELPHKMNITALVSMRLIKLVILKQQIKIRKKVIETLLL